MTSPQSNNKMISHMLSEIKTYFETLIDCKQNDIEMRNILFDCLVELLENIKQKADELFVPIDISHLVDKLNSYIEYDNLNLSGLNAENRFNKFMKENKFERQGWLPSQAECYGINSMIDDDWDHMFNCNWRSSTERCEGSYAHEREYCELINDIFYNIDT